MQVLFISDAISSIYFTFAFFMTGITKPESIATVIDISILDAAVT